MKVATSFALSLLVVWGSGCGNLRNSQHREVRDAPSSLLTTASMEAGGRSNGYVKPGAVAVWMADEFYAYKDLTLLSVTPVGVPQERAIFLGWAVAQLGRAKPNQNLVQGYSAVECLRDWPVDHPALMHGPKQYQAKAMTTFLVFLAARVKDNQPPGNLTVSGVEVEVADEHGTRYKLRTNGLEADFKVAPGEWQCSQRPWIPHGIGLDSTPAPVS